MAETLTAETQKDVLEAVRWAVAAGSALHVCGHASKDALGRPPSAPVRLDLAPLAGIVLYEPEELVLTARAATPMAEIAAALAERGQQLAFEPGNLGRLLGGPSGGDAAGGTLAGVIACNLAGPRRIKAGAARDHVLGFSAVSGRGESFKGGGRVVKNVTGFDLAKLMAGSYGTLAVITELTVRTMPVAEETRTIVALGLDDEAAMAAMAAALRSPYEISAAAHLPAAVARTSGVAAVCRPGSSVTALRIEGPAPSVAARVGPVAGLFAGSAPLDCLDPGASAELWREMADASFFAAGEGSPFRDHQVWRLSVPPAAGARTAGAITARTGGQACYDWGGGLVWLALPRCADANAAVVREEVAKTGGHATLVRAEAQVRAAVPVFQPQPPALAALTRRIKDGFDPKRALNPGRMYEGL